MQGQDGLWGFLHDENRRLAGHSPSMMIVGAPQFAMLRAANEFAGRDWRRVKREMNKAWRKAKRAH